MSPPPLLAPSVPTDTYSLSFTVSDLLQSNSFTLTPVDDTVPNEPNEVVQLVFFSISDGRVEQGPTAELVIVDDDDLGKLQTHNRLCFFASVFSHITCENLMEQYLYTAILCLFIYPR